MGSFNSKGVRRRMSVFGQNVESALQKELDDQKLRYKPESLHLLKQQTHFSEKELKYLYQCFKQNCPSGYVSREQFTQIFSELSMFTKGTLEQRLEWLFDLYDFKHKGFITEEDYFRVCRAMYSMVGYHYYKEKYFPLPLKRHVRHQFQKMDKNKDGKITRDEFLDGCMNDKDIIKQLDTLKTVW